MTPESLAHFLRKYGFPVLSWTEGDEHIDGEVKVNETISVQIGYFEPYAVVSRIDPARGIITHFPERGPRQKAAILADIRKMLDS